jgi:hypothetical protein
MKKLNSAEIDVVVALHQRFGTDKTKELFSSGMMRNEVDGWSIPNKQAEKRLVLAVLEYTGGNVQGACRILNGAKIIAPGYNPDFWNEYNIDTVRRAP